VTISIETRILLFHKAIEILECSRILETEPSITKWAWQSRTYVQWHAIAFLLAGLCCPHDREIASRAWRVIIGVFQEWGNDPYEQRSGQLWLPMRKLRDRVQMIWEDRFGTTVEDFLRNADATPGLTPEDLRIPFPSPGAPQKPLVPETTATYLTEAVPLPQDEIPFDSSTDNNMSSLSRDPKRRAFNFMPMLFNLVDSSMPEDLTNVDMESWNETEQYFNLELDRLGQI